MADAPVDTRTEKQAWEQTANTNDVNLRYVDLNDRDGMEELYGMMRVTGVAAKSRLLAFIAEQQQPVREVPVPALPETLTQEYSQEVWKSILRIRGDVEGDCATALVFDVHFDDKGGFLYLLTNNHLKLDASNTYHLEHCTPDNKFLEVDVFEYNDFHIQIVAGE